jgi:hypothetical protein
MSVYQAETSGTSSHSDDVLDNSGLLYTSIDGYTVSYNPAYIKGVSNQPIDISNVPLSWIDEDKGRCYVLDTETETLNSTTEAHLSLYAIGEVSSIMINNMPIADYILNINGINMCTSKHNKISLANPRSNSMLEIYQDLQQKVGCLDFGKIDRAQLYVSKDIKIPAKFYYTVIRPDGGQQTYCNYPLSKPLNSRLVTLNVPLRNELVLQLDGNIILHVKASPDDGTHTEHRITIYFSGKYLDNGPSRTTLYTDTNGTITLISYKAYEYPSFLVTYGW